MEAFKRFIYILRLFFCFIFCCCWTNSSIAYPYSGHTPVSSREEAIAYLEHITILAPSPHWPNVQPQLFLDNIKTNILTPLSMYEGSNTNFCGYAALSYLPLHNDPLGYARSMLNLYQNGETQYGAVFLQPSAAVQRAAGTLTFKGALDIHPADQVWFLTLADHFKGYLNLFNQHFNPGDEDSFWASMNYAKLNRIIRKMFNYKVEARGTDLIRPKIKDLYAYLSERLKTGTVILYINNAFLHKKRHYFLRPGVPTHYLVLLDIIKSDNNITLIYWDYGGKTLRQVTPEFLKKIVFGISYCVKKQ